MVEFWPHFGRSRYVTLHVTQAKLDLDVTSPAKTCGIDRRHRAELIPKVSAPDDLSRSQSDLPRKHFQKFRSVRPAGRQAGRTHISKFYSYGQPSVATMVTSFEVLFGYSLNVCLITGWWSFDHPTPQMGIGFVIPAMRPTTKLILRNYAGARNYTD